MEPNMARIAPSTAALVKSKQYGKTKAKASPQHLNQTDAIHGHGVTFLYACKS